ncbi:MULTISPECIES: ABC transporter ATP-binding protein [Lysinibacillus]|jgi:nickel transport system ATP-binding protein|uniref:ABC transporter ATP-binding protein n=1 Tax=Lysinibacillus fusiformis TaxID=28031 RepID=A0A2I0UZ90_9BACI|nr:MULTISPECIES: ATP-binding cassette domain-containing protein [Lysinibacillus]KUF37388.1 nickel import ATP-binding protein NikE [Lysinibacillus sp. F5]MEE3809560.1 ATP-binding cassette domain-containing protein [Lysinibacillus fusiformis]PKU51272.1 ABC transporter ATP-binding protein [Lysinibacillus fusiformis]WCH49702.1 ATP-binding cassette domain-containing protein [Lysinibacillus sp. OF-1]SCY06738.1 nickel transport system ATP-binding protein [Lysinibacillus sp. SG9]
MIQVQQVSKSYSQSRFFRKKNSMVKAVENVSLNIKEGSCFTLLGQSGSGKSTLGKMILGIEKPDDGVILFNGINVHKTTINERKRLQQSLQVVFQDCHSAVNPKLKIRDIIVEPILVYEKLDINQIEDRVGKLLKMVGLSEEDMMKYPQQFSGGQLQRITIARAISTQPRLIVLDESVNSLDVLVQISILKLLKRLQHELKLTYFFITHDIHVARLLADEIAIMHKGRIVEQLLIDELENAKHVATKVLLDSQLKIDSIHHQLDLKEELEL